MATPKGYFVYVMANARFTTLYVGVTNNLERRVWEHKHRVHPSSFTARYNLDRLVHFEDCADVEGAIAREKQLKSWSRARKDALIDGLNCQGRRENVPRGRSKTVPPGWCLTAPAWTVGWGPPP